MMRALILFVVVLEAIYIPLVLFVLSIGLLAYWDMHFSSQLLAILPIEEWSSVIRVFYQLLH